MVRTKVRPKKSKFDLPVYLPKKYVGKDVHVLFYTDDEIDPLVKKKPSDFFGTLSLEESKRLHDHVNKSRAEWSKGF